MLNFIQKNTKSPFRIFPVSDNKTDLFSSEMLNVIAMATISRNPFWHLHGAVTGALKQ